MSNSINHNFKIEAEILSPLHIGAGSEKDWVRGIDFIYDNNKLIKLNTRKMYEVLSNDISKLSNYIANRDENGLKSLIASKLNIVAEKKYDFGLETNNDIKAHIKTGVNNKPYIPGSSLKGAIRSILVNYFLNGDNQKYKGFEKDYFGSSSNGDEFMRFIKISDAHFEKTELNNTKIFNLYQNQKTKQWQGGWKHSGGKFGKTDNNFKSTGFNTIYETIESGEKSNVFSFSLSEQQFKQFNSENFYNNELKKTERINEYKKKDTKIKSILSLIKNIDNKNKLLKKDTDNLFSVINAYTKKYIKKEIDFFTKYSNKETQNIIDYLHKILKSIPENNSACVLRMSGGSGFHSVTGDWQHDSHKIDGVFKGQGQLNREKSAKSRKIAVSGENYIPMGFIKLHVLTDEEIKQREEQEAERIKLEQEKAEQRRKERAAQELKQQKLNKLIKEANDFYVAKQYEKAIEKYKEAQIIDENINVSSKIENSQIELDKIAEQKRREAELRQFEEAQKEKEAELQKRQEENRIKREQEAKELLKEGLVFADNLDDFNTGKSIIETFFKAKNEKIIEGENANTLKEFIIRCIKKSNKRWRKQGKQDWKLVEKWVGNDIAKQWFNEIVK